MTSKEIAEKVLAKLSPNALSSLEWAGIGSVQVADDADEVRAGRSSELLAACLRGVESDDGQDVADGYREYVQRLADAVEADRVAEAARRFLEARDAVDAVVSR